MVECYPPADSSGPRHFATLPRSARLQGAYAEELLSGVGVCGEEGGELTIVARNETACSPRQGRSEVEGGFPNLDFGAGPP